MKEKASASVESIFIDSKVNFDECLRERFILGKKILESALELFCYSMKFLKS